MKTTIGEASRNVSKLIEAAERGESVVITRHGKPIVEMVRIQPKTRRPLGFLRGEVREIDPNWWRSMTDEESDAFLEGRD